VKKTTYAVPRGNSRYRLRSPKYRKKKSSPIMSFITKIFWLSILICFIVIVVSFISNMTRLSLPVPYSEHIKKYANLNDMDPLLIAAIIREESRFQAKAVSNKGACGLMQLMPDTAQEVAQELGEVCTRADLMLPETNIRYGTAYFASLLRKYDGDLILALAAYNAGFGRVDGWVAKHTGAFTIDDIPFRETRDYVRKVLESYKTYQQLNEGSQK
jgi:soluble lytic murein transglycosylase